MKLFLAMFGVLAANLCLGQCANAIDFGCGEIRYKPGHSTDTVQFRAKLLEIGKVAQAQIIRKLRAKKLIGKREYKTAIRIIPSGCADSLYLPYKSIDDATNNLLYQRQSQDQTICIRAIFVKGFTEFSGKPFFLIDKLWLE